MNPRGRLSIVLLVASRDANDCCAKNLERTLFRDRKIVLFARKSLVAYRLDRAKPVGTAIYEKYSLNTDKPALILFDSDGDPLYIRQRCIEPRDYYRGLRAAVGFARKKRLYSGQKRRTIERAGEKVARQDFRGALYLLQGIRAESLLIPLREKLRGFYATIEAAGSRGIEVAAELENRGELDKAGEVYHKVLLEFSRLEKIRDRARAGLARVRRRAKG